MKDVVITEATALTKWLKHARTILGRHVNARESAVLIAQAIPIISTARFPLHQIIVDVHDLKIHVMARRRIVDEDHSVDGASIFVGFPCCEVAEA